jgi:hypothetical protein
MESCWSKNLTTSLVNFAYVDEKIKSSAYKWLLFSVEIISIESQAMKQRTNHQICLSYSLVEVPATMNSSQD